MQTQLVHSGQATAYQTPAPRFSSGDHIRLRPELDEVYMVVVRDGKHQQLLVADVSILKSLRRGITVRTVEQLKNAVPNLGSDASEDCFYRLFFGAIGSFQNWLYYPEWLFESFPQH